MKKLTILDKIKTIEVDDIDTNDENKYIKVINILDY